MKTAHSRDLVQKPPRLKSETNGYPAVVESGALYTLAELAKRLRWKRHSIRQARRLGLPVIRFGSRDYVIGQQALEWFAKLGQQQSQQVDTET